MSRRGQDEPDEVIAVDVRGLAGTFSPPPWLRDLGLLSWLLVGIGAVLVGLVWLLGQTETIVIPVVIGFVVAAVASPLVGRIARGRVPRPLAAALVMLGVVAIGIVVILLVAAGLTSEAASIKPALQDALSEVESWLTSLGISQSDVKSSVENAVPKVAKSLAGGLGGAVSGISSVAVMLSFAAFATFFLLADGPSMRRWTEGHMGVPEPVARVVTRDTLRALRGYFLGVTVVAVFNGGVVGIGALLLGVPLPGTIALVTFVGAYIPFLGAWVAGIFAVALALADGGSDMALAMGAVAFLSNGPAQQIVQPIAMGATLSLNPLVVLVVTIAGGSLFGMVGLVLSAPIVSAIVNISKDLARARAAEEQAAPEDAPATG